MIVNGSDSNDRPQIKISNTLSFLHFIDASITQGHAKHRQTVTN